MYILCVISFPSGIEINKEVYKSLIGISIKYNWKIKIEIRDRNQIINYITEDDIKHADGVIIASEMLENNIVRFMDLPILECAISDPIRQPDTVAKVLQRIIQDGSPND